MFEFRLDGLPPLLPALSELGYNLNETQHLVTETVQVCADGLCDGLGTVVQETLKEWGLLLAFLDLVIDGFPDFVFGRLQSVTEVLTHFDESTLTASDETAQGGA